MKRPVVDYRAFRPDRINEPQYRHLWLLAGWVVYFALYFFTERLIPISRCHVIHSALDDLIPFNEGFLILYCYWYVLIVVSLLWFLLYDIPDFKRLQIFIMITQAAAMLVYIVYPSYQPLRPEAFARDNPLTRLMAFIYAFDTPTGVCPSLHVAYSLGIATVWCRREETGTGLKLFMIASAALISISTAFVKQHSVVDILAALPLGLLADRLIYANTPLRRWIERS